jgi:ribosomal protein S18 acetylase RimI-like enzyme
MNDASGKQPATSATALRVVPATTADDDRLWPMVEALNTEDGHPVDERALRALRVLLEPANAFGFVRLIEADGACVGYATICFGFSVEFGGRDAFLDELYLRPAARGHGLGARVLDALATELAALGVVALHLEVMPDNPANRLYARAGFKDRGRLMTKTL